MRWCALISLLLACGGGEGQQCEIFSDCPSGQVCLMNVCTDLDAGTDAAEDGAIPTTCGNGMLDPGEECDQGAANADEADTCRLNCSFPTCGDSIVDRGEGCDDGNDQIFDTCTPQCRVESAECVVVHSGDERGSTFTTVTLSGGLPGVVRGLSTTHAHTNEVEHSLVRCGARLFAATDGGILALGLRNGAPIAGALEPSGDVRELACSDGELFAVDPRSLSRYSVTETGLSLIDTVELPFEMRNQTRVIPFARAGGIMLIAISARGAGSTTGPGVARYTVSDGALTLTGTFQLGGSARGKAADVSPDGSALLATNPLGCTSRWELVADSAPSIGCGDISESLLATTVLSENETATLGWSGTSAGAVRFDASTWTPTQTLGGFRTDLLTRGSSAFVAVGEDQLTVLNDPPASVLMATSGEIRGAVVVPCAP